MNEPTAKEMRQPHNRSTARQFELAGQIDSLIGEMGWTGERTEISWPRAIAEAAGEPARCKTKVSS